MERSELMKAKHHAQNEEIEAKIRKYNNDLDKRSEI